MVVELISVGTEILLGNIVNTNAAYLAEKCALLGCSLYHQTVVGDNEERMEEAIRQAIERADIVILTGGLGPTKDDLTKEVTAKVFGAALAVASLVFYYSGSLDLSRCILILIASFMVYQELENAGNMSDNLQMLGESMRKANSIDDTPTMDTHGSEIRPEDASVEFKNVSFSYGDRKILDGVSIQIPAGTGFMQGIFVEYGITVDDDAEAVRNGGFGSTTKA